MVIAASAMEGMDKLIMQAFYRNKNVLITGHTGFKGSWLSQILLSFGARVSGVALAPHTKPNLFGILGLAERLRHHCVDIRDVSALRMIFSKEKPEIVFHLAAQPIVRTSYTDPLSTFATNAMGTANILESVRKLASVRSVVIITTDKVYHNTGQQKPYKETDRLGGFDPYSASKAAADIIAQSFSLSFFHPRSYGKTHHALIGIARAGNVIGGGDWADDRLVPDMVRALFHPRRAKTLFLRNPAFERPWQHVFEPLFGYLLLAKKLHEGRTEFASPFNFGPDNDSQERSVEYIAKAAIRHFERGSYAVRPDPSKHEDAVLRLDIRKSKTILGWRPVLSTTEGLRWTLDWYRTWYERPAFIQKLTEEQWREYCQTANLRGKIRRT